MHLLLLEKHLELFKEVFHLKEQEFSMLSVTSWLFSKLEGKYHMRSTKCSA